MWRILNPFATIFHLYDKACERVRLLGTLFLYVMIIIFFIFSLTAKKWPRFAKSLACNSILTFRSFNFYLPSVLSFKFLITLFIRNIFRSVSVWWNIFHFAIDNYSHNSSRNIYMSRGWKLINSIASAKSYSPRIENAPLFLSIVRKRFRFQFNYSLEQIYSANVLSWYVYECDYLVAVRNKVEKYFEIKRNFLQNFYILSSFLKTTLKICLAVEWRIFLQIGSI